MVGREATKEDTKERVVGRIAADLGKKDPKIETYFRNNVGKFDNRINTLVSFMRGEHGREKGEYPLAVERLEKQIVDNYKKSLEEK